MDIAKYMFAALCCLGRPRTEYQGVKEIHFEFKFFLSLHGFLWCFFLNRTISGYLRCISVEFICRCLINTELAMMLVNLSGSEKGHL